MNKLILSSVLSILFFFAHISFLKGEVILVENAFDDGSGSLRQAIRDAQPNDEIMFDEALRSKTILFFDGEILINKNLTITGLGMNELMLDGNVNSRIFRITHNATVLIRDISIQKGWANKLGGAILNYGNLTLENCSFEENVNEHFEGKGGAIYSEGKLTIDGSHFVKNHSSGNGGAIYQKDAELEMKNSLVFDNLTHYVGGGLYMSGENLQMTNTRIIYNAAGSTGAGTGGGIYLSNIEAVITASTIYDNIAAGDPGSGSGGGLVNDGGSIQLSNSTISSNRESGGGIGTGSGISNRNGGEININFCTITQNKCWQRDPQAGGIYNCESCTITIGNSIIAENDASNRFRTLFPDIGNFGTLISHGYNLIGINDFGFNFQIGDQFGTLSSPLDPLLDIINDNSGFTPTHALLPGSPAINAADPNTSIQIDQRGLFRPQNIRADIGAFEVEYCGESDYIMKAINTSTDSLQTGGMLQIGSRMLNQGPGDASIPTQLGYFLSADSMFERSSDILLGELSIPPLDSAAEMYDMSNNIYLPPNQSPGNYYLFAVADYEQLLKDCDEENNKLHISLSLTPPNATADTIHLHAGWNLISLDVKPIDSDPTAVFVSLKPNNLQLVMGYKEGQALYAPSVHASRNTLQQLEIGYGYWVQVNEADTLIVDGLSIAPSYRKPLKSGWNLIAYIPQENSHPTEYFADLIAERKLLSVSGFELGIGQQFFKPENPPELNILQLMYNGKGYLVRVK